MGHKQSEEYEVDVRCSRRCKKFKHREMGHKPSDGHGIYVLWNMVSKFRLREMGHKPSDEYGVDVRKSIRFNKFKHREMGHK